MPRTYVRERSSRSYSLEDLLDITSDVMSQNMTFSEAFTLEEVLKRFKEAEEAKLIRELKRKGVTN